MSNAIVRVGDNDIGAGQPAYFIAEIGINHNGSLETAIQLIEAAKASGCDAVKFQKRTPEICVPEHQRNVPRSTPWGDMTYLEYKKRIEFEKEEFNIINEHCRKLDIDWFASCWDLPSLEFMETFAPVCYKIASATLTDDELLRRHRDTGRPVILSTGMSTLDEVDHAVEVLGTDKLILLHCNSSYPADISELNLACMSTLRDRYGVPVGYSGHELGLAPTFAAVCLGACLVERHITLNRAMWGTDQSASVEPQGISRLIRDIRVFESALGDGIKRVYESEMPSRKKLRGSI